jgi:hypothetical protein
MGAHEPMLYWAGRHGSWGECACGRWRSLTWSGVVGVHLEFGQHLLTENRAEAAR